MIKTSWIRLVAVALCLTSSPGWSHEVVFEQDTNLPIVNLNVALKAGNTTDPAEKSGLTRFLAQMFLRGTRSKTKDQVDQILDQMGAKLEVEIRAEALIFRGAVLSDQLDRYLTLLQEILTQPRFAQNEIEKLKKETLGLIKEELGHDSELGGRAFNQFLFQGHPYGKPVLGKERDVQTFSRSDLLAHQKRLLRKSLLLVVGSGDSSQARITKWAMNLVHLMPDTQLRQEDQNLIAQVSIPKMPEHTRYQIVDKPERTQTQIFGGQIGTRMTDPFFFPLHVGNYAFGGRSFSATLMTEIRVKRGWSYGAYSYFREGLKPRSWIFHLFPAEKATPAALSHTLKLIAGLREDGLSAKQFAFAKESLINNAGFMYSTPQKRIENTLLEKTLNLPEGFMKSYAARIATVSHEDTNLALRNFLKPNQLAITVVGTASTLKSPLAKALGISEDQIEVKPYTEN